VQIAFAPTWDGALPVLHAATTPLVHDDAQLQNTTASLRLFARGAFAWPMVQKFTTLACSYTLQYRFSTTLHVLLLLVFVESVKFMSRIATPA